MSDRTPACPCLECTDWRCVVCREPATVIVGTVWYCAAHALSGDPYQRACATVFNGAALGAGVKNDAGKPAMHLLPWDALAALCVEMHIGLIDLPWAALVEVAKVLEFGARKYAPRNWEKGLPHSRTFAAYMRHIAAFQMGEHADPETKLSPLAHAACEVMFAYTFECRDTPGVDDLPDVEVTGDPPVDGMLGSAVDCYVAWWHARSSLGDALYDTLRALEADLVAQRSAVSP